MSVPANCMHGPQTQMPIGGDIRGGSAEEIPENVLFGEPPNDLYCPEPGSREAADAEPCNRYTVETQDEDVLIMHGGATTLILEGELTGRALVSGGGARIILVDAREPQGMVYLNGGGSEIIRCNERKMRENLLPCTRYF